MKPEWFVHVSTFEVTEVVCFESYRDALGFFGGHVGDDSLIGVELFDFLGQCVRSTVGDGQLINHETGTPHLAGFYAWNESTSMMEVAR